MRRILVDRARGKLADKRGGGEVDRTRMDENVSDPAHHAPEHILAVHEALEKLEQHDESKAEPVRLRYFAGFSLVECAKIVDRSVTTLKRDWASKPCCRWLRLSSHVADRGALQRACPSSEGR